MALKKSSNLKKKELNAQIESMQMEIRKRHSDELSAILSQQFESSEINVAVEKVLEDESVEAVDLERKPNKSKRRRDKKAHEFAESRREAAEEALLLPNMKDIEDKKMSDLAAKINCFVSPIAADGHCLYSAVCRQLLITTGENLNYRDLRKVTATYLMEHSEDFIPFLVNDKGNSLSAVEFSQYCNDCEYKAIQAMSQALQRIIQVMQIDCPLLSIGDKFGGKPLRLTYHRFTYTLGEHYNSLEEISYPH